MNFFKTFAVFCLLQLTSLIKADEDYREEFPKLNQKQYQTEVNAGNLADLFGTLQEFHPHKYKHLNRRVGVPSSTKDKKAEAKLHAAIEKSQIHDDNGPKLIPKRAPPEVVLAIAEQSKKAKLDDFQHNNPTDENIRNLLRSGEYWNGVWKEDVDPESILRTNTKHKLGAVKVKIMPGSKLYELVSVLKKISPRLLYVINKKD